MSDAMTSREIEDVLSSVRRLVSQESQRPATTRLILTQAQRIAPEVAQTPAPRKHLEDTIAELEAAVSAIGETWESEAGEAGPVTAPLGAAHPTPANVTAFARRAAAAVVETTPVAEITPPVAPTPEPATLEPATLEPATLEPATREPASVEPVREAMQAAALDPDEAVLDEETLRQVVAVLVREELQGQLGERVTFQVRKLVRAEIARILDERDLI